jgi:ABC-type transport system involved in multi-copper enzyme maturation permease subunit
MIWLTWRQFRVQALIGVAALAVLTIFLVFLGFRIRHTYDFYVGCTGCNAQAATRAMTDKYLDVLMLTGLLVILVPALIGAFWGAPLVAREFETGTHRLVWNQSVTRTRWLAVKLVVVTVAAVALTGALTALLTWAASPYDKLIDNRFDPLLFAARNIVPLGYAAFAVLAGITIGLLTRRTVVAMAITLALFAGLQILLPTVIRPHFEKPVTTSVAFKAGAANGIGMNEAGQVFVHGITVPGSWVLTPEGSLYDAAGKPATREQINPCMTGRGPDQDFRCIEGLNLHSSLTYQPADRYWTFQWLELAVYLVLAALLAGFAFWRIPRGLN